MMKDITNNAVWTKTQALIQDKYGKKIGFKTLGLTETKAEFLLKGDDLIIPLNSHAFNLGEVVVNRGSLLSQEQRIEVIDLVKFLIEPHVYNKHLQLKEEMEIFKKETSAADNVFTLFNSEIEESIIQLVSTVIHLKSSQELTRKKVAMKLHDMAEQNMFVNFSDIAKQMHSAEEFKSLEKTTVYIEDLAKLNQTELLLLDSASQLKISGLVFIIGSNLEVEQINAMAISQNLKNDLNAILFDIDRLPYSQQTNTDVLELLFFRFDNFN